MIAKSVPLGFLLLAIPAVAQERPCTASLRAIPSSWPSSVPIIGGPEAYADIVVEQEGDCDTVLVMDDTEVMATASSGRLPIRISAVPSGWTSGRLEQRSGPGTMRLFWRPSPTEAPRAGSYAVSVPVRMEGRNGLDVLAETVLDFSVEVPAALSAVRSDAPGNSVPLGDLARGTRTSVVFDVSSNATFSVSLDSASGMKLVHDASPATIGYSATMLPTGFASSGSRLLAGSGSVAIEVTVPPSPGMPAGDYADTLTVVFRAEQ